MKKSILTFLFFLFFSLPNGFGQTSVQKNPNSTLNLAVSKQREITNDEIIYRVEPDNQTLSAHENKKLKWKTNIIEVCGKPEVGKAEIRIIKLNGEKIQVIFGKHNFAEVQIETGKTKFLGAD